MLTADNFTTYFETNEFVKYVLFDQPRDLAITTTSDPVRGTICINPNQATHVETTLVDLTAVAKPGYVFANWVGLNQDDPAADATANSVILRMLDNRAITANFGLTDISLPVVIDAPISGNWAVPAGVYSITFQAWGGGGAGGSVHHRPGSTDVSVRGGGGAGGSYASKTLPVSPGQVIHYTVGVGGVESSLAEGEDFPSASYGGEGGSTFASLDGGPSMVLAVGGPGGNNKSGSTSSTGGSASAARTTGNLGDDVHYGGSGGGTSSSGTGGGGGSAGSQGDGGDGTILTAGIAGLGGGASGGAGHNSSTNGNQGGYPGGGGSGAAVRNNSLPSATRVGGTGGNGKMIVTYNTMTFTLTTNAVNGNVTLDLPGGGYRSGTMASVSAIPNPGYDFTGWTGSLTGTNRTASILIDGNKSITAHFVIKPQAGIHRLEAGGGFEIKVKNLQPTSEYELQSSTDLTSDWTTVPGSSRNNITETTWTINPAPGETRKFFRVITRN